MGCFRRKSLLSRLFFLLAVLPPPRRGPNKRNLLSRTPPARSEALRSQARRSIFFLLSFSKQNRVIVVFQRSSFTRGRTTQGKTFSVSSTGFGEEAADSAPLKIDRLFRVVPSDLPIFRDDGQAGSFVEPGRCWRIFTPGWHTSLEFAAKIFSFARKLP